MIAAVLRALRARAERRERRKAALADLLAALSILAARHPRRVTLTRMDAGRLRLEDRDGDSLVVVHEASGRFGLHTVGGTWQAPEIARIAEGLDRDAVVARAAAWCAGRR